MFLHTWCEQYKRYLRVAQLQKRDDRAFRCRENIVFDTNDVHRVYKVLYTSPFVTEIDQ